QAEFEAMRIAVRARSGHGARAVEFGGDRGRIAGAPQHPFLPHESTGRAALVASGAGAVDPTGLLTAMAAEKGSVSASARGVTTRSKSGAISLRWKWARAASVRGSFGVNGDLTRATGQN